ncbi:MAG TPA: ABC transporter permease [Burkholderiaceae bacterium]|nr:ABC transporter permease [Burkholderiaceae bacterium]
MKQARVVFVKECIESLRDRRVLLNALVLGPLLTPLLFLVLVHLIVGRELEKAEKPLPVVVIGQKTAPNFVEALEQQGMLALPEVSDPEAAVREQRLDLVLRILPRFADDWREGRPAQVELIYDSSRQEVRGEVERLESMIQAFSTRTGSLRLLARGIAPSVIMPVVMAGRDQATPQARGALLLGMLPYFLILTALIGGMWLAIDSTAGERERQSLEPLLVNPVDRSAVLLGKMLATAVFSMASLILGLLAFVVVGHLMPSDEPSLGLRIGSGFVSSALAVMTPLVLLIAIAQIWVASFARSFREAQTYLGLAQLLPLIPSVLMMAVPMRPRLWMAAVPLFGQQVTILRLLRGEAVDALAIGIGASVTLGAAAAIFGLTLRLFGSERVAISS